MRISRSGFSFSGSAGDVEWLAAEFKRRHCIRVTQLLDPPLLAAVQKHIQGAEFVARTHDGIGVEQCMAQNAVGGLLHFLLNQPGLFRLVETITRCGAIGCFAGRVYRMHPGEGHYDSWHNDAGEGRLIGMSLNLSTALFAGSAFQLRERGSKQVLCEVANTGFGDAILFRIAPELQHRITELEGNVPKTAFAGWFQSGPDYRSLAAFGWRGDGR